VTPASLAAVHLAHGLDSAAPMKASGSAESTRTCLPSFVYASTERRAKESTERAIQAEVASAVEEPAELPSTTRSSCVPGSA
jgi:hypothetical protein